MALNETATPETTEQPLSLEQTATNASANRLQWMIVFGAIAAYLAATLLLMPTFQTGAYQDDALYINLANSIANGHGYVDLMHPGNPPHTQVPPVYPVLLSPLLGLFDYGWLLARNFWPLQVQSMFLVLSGLACFLVILRERQVAGWGLVFAIATLAPLTVGMGWHVMSEAPYFLFSLAALMALTIWAKRQNQSGWLIVALVCAMVASATRLVGITLLVAIAAFLWGRLRPTRWLVAVGVLFSPIALWPLRNTILGSAAAGEYVTQLTPTSAGAFARSIAVNLISITTGMIPNTLVPGLGGPQTSALFSRLGYDSVPTVLGGLVFVVILIGLIWTVKRYSSGWVVETYVALYFALLLMARMALDGGERYLAPIFPFLVLYFWLGSAWVLSRIPGFRSQTRVTRVMGIACAVLMLLYLARTAQAVVRPVRERLPDVTLGTMWLRASTPVDTVVMASSPREVYLYSEREVIPFPSVIDDRVVLAQRIACSAADYVLVRPKMAPGTPSSWDNATQQLIIPTLEESSVLFEETYASIDGFTRVYRIKRPVDLTCP